MTSILFTLGRCPRLTEWSVYTEAQPLLTREVASRSKSRSNLTCISPYLPSSARSHRDRTSTLTVTLALALILARALTLTLSPHPNRIPQPNQVAAEMAGKGPQPKTRNAIKAAKRKEARCAAVLPEP